MTENKTAPEVPRADLIVRLRTVSNAYEVKASVRTLINEAADALAALGDTVPREQHDLSVLELSRQISNTRDERDALAHVMEQVRRWDEATRANPQLGYILSTAPAVSLALHDAEVFDQGWNACQSLAHDQEPFKQVRCDNPYRAAATR